MRKIFTILTLLLSFLFIELSAQNWTEQVSGTDSALFDVCFVNHDIAYACGAHGTILKTTNGGTTWLPKNSGIIDGLACIQFVSENIGYASGGFAGGTSTNCRLIKTIDGGDTWSNVNVAPTKCGGGIRFLNPDIGFYAYADNLYGNSVIAKTTDGGSSWNIVHSGIGWISYFHFVDAIHGFATVNNGTVLKTTDGGQSWSTLNLPATIWGSGVYFLNKDTGFVGGTGSQIYKTVDGGANWTPIASSNMIFKICFSDNTNGYALSVDETGAGDIIRSTNAGESWLPESTPKGKLSGISFLNTNLGYAVGNRGVILKFSIPTDVKQIISQNNIFTLYPNPASDLVALTMNYTDNANMTLNIYNVAGTLVKTEILEKNNVQINIENLNHGIYMVEIISKDWNGKQKLIIQ